MIKCDKCGVDIQNNPTVKVVFGEYYKGKNGFTANKDFCSRRCFEKWIKTV